MKKKPRHLTAGLVIGVLLCLSPLLGLLGTILGMKRAFASLGTSGVGDPEVLSGQIGGVLLWTAGGIVLFFVGVVLVTYCLVKLRRLEKASPPTCQDKTRNHPPPLLPKLR